MCHTVVLAARADLTLMITIYYIVNNVYSLSCCYVAEAEEAARKEAEAEAARKVEEEAKRAAEEAKRAKEVQKKAQKKERQRLRMICEGSEGATRCGGALRVRRAVVGL